MPIHNYTVQIMTTYTVSAHSEDDAIDTVRELIADNNTDALVVKAEIMRNAEVYDAFKQ